MHFFFIRITGSGRIHPGSVVIYSVRRLIARITVFMFSKRVCLQFKFVYLHTGGADVVRLASIGNYSSLHRNLVPTLPINNV